MDPPASMAAALLDLIENRERRLTMAAAAREYALSQSWDAIMTGLRRRYEVVIDEHAAAASANRVRI